MIKKVEKTEEEWRQQLGDDAYEVLRKKGTERPFTGEFYMHKEKGTYNCKGCDLPLFAWDGKFDSGCGWPSFFKPLSKDAIEYKLDQSHGMTRVEILCAACGGHLGHVFNDGPEPGGYRYCVNSASLLFTSDDTQK